MGGADVSENKATGSGQGLSRPKQKVQFATLHKLRAGSCFLSDELEVTQAFFSLGHHLEPFDIFCHVAQ